VTATDGPFMPNAGAWPTGISRTRVVLDGQVIEIALDWRMVKGMAAATLINRTGRTVAGGGTLVVRKVNP